MVLSTAYTTLGFLYGENALAIVEANFVRLSNLGGKNRIRWKDFPIQNIHAASVGTGYASSLLLTSGLAKYHAQCILLKASDPLDKWVETIGHMQPNYISGYRSFHTDLQNSRCASPA